jgi:hypothetical protein
MLIAIQPAGASQNPPRQRRGPDSIPATSGISAALASPRPARELAAMAQPLQANRDGQTINGVYL